MFFHRAAGFLAFAPMARALFAVPGVPRRLCFQSVADGLVLVPLPPEASLYGDIRSLEPGHMLVRELDRELARHRPGPVAGRLRAMGHGVARDLGP